jgi:hypothetical protein
MSKTNETNQDYDNVGLMLNDLEDEVTRVYAESTRCNSKLNNYITSKSLSNQNANDNTMLNRTDTPALGSIMKTYTFYDIICKKCLEHHLDKCDLCSYKNESIKSKSSLSKSYKSILINPSTSKTTRTSSSNKKSNLVNFDINYHPEINHAVKSVSNIDKFSSMSINSDEINKSIYAVVFKEKTCSDLNENQIEDLIYGDFIDVSNLSTPFEKEFINDETVDKVRLANKPDFLVKRKKTLMLLDMNQRAKLSKIRVSKHYFKNLSDLQQKYKHENEKITFKSIPPFKKSSNILFNEIDKFDVNESYKVKKPMMNDVNRLIEQNKALLESIRIKEKAEQPFNGFVSTRKFDKELFKKDRYKVRLDSPLNQLNNFNLNLNRYTIKIN